MTKHWYRVDIEGPEKRILCGSTELDPAQFMNELSSAAFIRLDDLFYKDKENQFRSWDYWEPRLQPIVFIRCAAIVVVMPFKADPRTGQPEAT